MLGCILKLWGMVGLRVRAASMGKTSRHYDQYMEKMDPERLLTHTPENFAKFSKYYANIIVSDH